MTQPRWSKEDRTWPYGRMTALCPDCEGRGTDREKVMAYMRSRQPPERITLDVNCTTCEGHGRILLDEKVETTKAS